MDMSDVRCAFTSTQSSWTGVALADCCQNKKAWALIRCDSCTPGHPVFRCTECYHKFGTTCRRRLPEIEKHQGATVVKAPEVKALLSVDFRRLASGEAAAGHELLEYLERVKLKDGKDCAVWRWREQCPGCYDFEVPKIEPAMPAAFPGLPVLIRTT